MKSKKDTNFINLEKIYELEKEKIKARIKEIEDEFDILDDKLQHWDLLVANENSKISPLITLKQRPEGSYFYVYFRIDNKKWTKSTTNSVDFALEFTQEDIDLIKKNKDRINLYALRFVMSPFDFEKVK